MRILHVINEMTVGGAERLVLQLSGDAGGRCDDDVAVASSGGEWVGRLIQLGVDVHHVPPHGRSPAALVAAAARLAAVLRSFRPELVHTHNVGVTVAARLAMLAAPPRPALVTTLHGLAPGDYALAARLLRRSSRRVVACAPAVRASVIAAGFPEDRVDVIPNAAQLMPAGPKRQAALRSRLGLPEGPLVVGVGRLVEQKSWPTLIDAATRMPFVNIVVAGDGPLRPALEDAARRAGAHLRFVGAVDDVPAFLGLAACFVSTSSWEGLPLSLLEALSLGLPCVATAVDGVVDVVPDDAAILVPPGDADAVARAVAVILSDDAVATNLSSAASRVSVRWSPSAMIAAYRDAYAHALA